MATQLDMWRFVHGDIRHLENGPTIQAINPVVHGDIRHLEISKGQYFT